MQIKQTGGYIMQSTSKWQEKFRSIVDNGRGHQVEMDLPPAKNGEDKGATAFEFTLMALSGCITTIYAMIAANSNVKIDAMEAVCTAETNEAGTEYKKVVVENKVSSDADQEMLERLMTKTIAACPVGNLFKQANIPLEEKVIKI
jgi:putative redox protein